MTCLRKVTDAGVNFRSSGSCARVPACSLCLEARDDGSPGVPGWHELLLSRGRTVNGSASKGSMSCSDCGPYNMIADDVSGAGARARNQKARRSIQRSIPAYSSYVFHGREGYDAVLICSHAYGSSIAKSQTLSSHTKTDCIPKCVVPGDLG